MRYSTKLKARSCSETAAENITDNGVEDMIIRHAKPVFVNIKHNLKSAFADYSSSDLISK